MNKDSKASPGRSFCDFCGKPATSFDGKFVVCDEHKKLTGEKRASAEQSLRAAPLTMADKHQ
jgi:hypothetical protein